MELLVQLVQGVLVVIVVLSMLSIVYVSIRNGISPMPASSAVRRIAAAEVNKLSSKGILLDAGSGWGTLAQQVANTCPGWRVIGIENSIAPLWVSKILSRILYRSANVTFEYGDLYLYDYKGANAVICYLYPGAMKRLSAIWADRLEPGTVVISLCFAIPGWQAERVITCSDLYRTPIYLYRIEKAKE